MATFHDLAPELLVMILRALDSPRDLHALISASPTCLKIFISRRAPILASVLTSAIHSAALHHALAVLHAPPPPPSPNSHHAPHHPPQGASPPEIITSFLDKYFSGDTFELPADIPGLIALCRLWSLVSRFSNAYYRRATRRLEKTPVDELGPARPAPLSTTERARLERAFFRFELYSRLFSVQGRHRRKSVLSSDDQFRLFLARLKPWEVEEMSCVHNYFTSIVRGLIEDLEERIVHAVLSLPGLIRVNESAPLPAVTGPATGAVILPGLFEFAWPPAQKGPDKDSVAFEWLDLHGLDLFEQVNHNKIPGFIHLKVSSGLDYMARLFDGNDELRKNMIREHTPSSLFSRDFDFLPEALRHSPRLEFLYTGPPYAAGDAVEGDPCLPNAGYCVYGRQAKKSNDRIYDPIYDDDPLSEKGYVFWDAGRIDVPAVKRSLAHAKGVSRGETNERSWSERTSVQEMLRGIRMPRGQMKQVVKEFGDGGSDVISDFGDSDEFDEFLDR